MLSRRAIASCKHFYVQTVSPLSDPRGWIENCIKRNNQEMATAEVIEELLKNLDAFLSIDEVFDSLEYGGIYDCDVVFNKKITKWRFEFSEGNPYQACLKLSLIVDKGDKKWLPPQA